MEPESAHVPGLLRSRSQTSENEREWQVKAAEDMERKKRRKEAEREQERSSEEDRWVSQEDTTRKSLSTEMQ